MAVWKSVGKQNLLGIGSEKFYFEYFYKVKHSHPSNCLQKEKSMSIYSVRKRSQEHDPTIM